MQGFGQRYAGKGFSQRDRKRKKPEHSGDSSQDLGADVIPETPQKSGVEEKKPKKLKDTCVEKSSAREVSGSRVTIREHFNTVRRSSTPKMPTSGVSNEDWKSVYCDSENGWFSKGNGRDKGELAGMRIELERVNGTVFELRKENETLSAELASCKKRIETMERGVGWEAKFEAGVAHARSDDVEQYTE
nr:hypothetical protein BaRGS_024149 [Batillaria attramentaria]